MAATTIKIAQGDTLGGLAKTHGTSIDALMKSNPNIKNPNLIIAGANLNLPTVEPVSPEVRNNVAATPEIAENPDLGMSKNDVSDSVSANKYINRFNNKSELNKPEDRSSSIRTLAKDLEADFADGSQAPKRISLLDEYKKQRKEAGLSDMEELINQYSLEEKDLYANLRINKFDAEGKPVALGVMAGRIGEMTRQAREDLDFVSRQKSYVVDSYNSKLSAINKIMDFTAKDYEYAVEDYERDFAIKKQMYQMAENEYEADIREQEKEYDIFKEQRMDARANGEIVVNTAIKSGKTYDEMDADTQANLQKWGIQAGFGENFFKNMFDIAQEKDIISSITSKDKSTVTMIMRDQMGNIVTKKIKTGMYEPVTSRTGAAISKNQAMVSKLKTIFADDSKSQQDKISEALAAGANTAEINLYLRSDPKTVRTEREAEQGEQTVAMDNAALGLIIKHNESNRSIFDSRPMELDATHGSIISDIAEARTRGGLLKIPTGEGGGNESFTFNNAELDEIEKNVRYNIDQKKKDVNWFSKVLYKMEK